MIERIEKIANYGIFIKQGKSPEFTRHTAIYGWNGSGKTSLSKLFAELGKDTKRYSGSKYSVTINGSSVDDSIRSDFAIVVFNDDYVRENAPSVHDVSKSSKHIFSIGKESREFAEKLNSDMKEKDRIDTLLNRKSFDGTPSLKEQYNAADKRYETIFTDIARTISASSMGVVARNYRRDTAKEAFKGISVQNDLDENIVAQAEKRANQEKKDEVWEIDVSSFGMKLQSVYHRAVKAVTRKIVRGIVVELEETQEKSDWALSGFRMHEEAKIKDCLFCGSTITKQRWSDLELFFSPEYQALNTEVGAILDELREVYDSANSLSTPMQSLIYQDLHEDYARAVTDFNKAKSDLLEQIKACGLRVNTKLQNLNSEVLIGVLDDSILQIKSGAVNAIIREHNSRSNNIDKDKEAATAELETLYLGSIYDDAEEARRARDSLKASIKVNETRLESLTREIADNEAKARNSHLGCSEINKTLVRLLGRDDLQLRDEKSGYNIYRGDELATDLSEGEKTIITFSYFLASATIDQARLKNTIIVIDDPVSSLDVDLIHKIFAAIKTRLSKANQLIILTHNFEALNHIKKWYLNVPDRENDFHSLLMIRNDLYDKRRCALIEPLDPTLRNYETEYHYLFHRLLELNRELQSSGEPQLAHVYDYPNIARKVLECYLSFKTPNNRTISSGLRELHNAFREVTSEMTNDAESFINSGSHLNSKTGLLQFDSALTKNIKHYAEVVLRIIELSDPVHYEAMAK